MAFLSQRNKRMEEKTGTANRGEFRELTPSEIGHGVSQYRSLLGLKQLALALEAGVTERTTQRIEAGQRVDSESLRRVARALRLSDEAFVGPRYRLESCRELLTAIQQIEAEGYTARYGCFWSSERLTVAALTFVRNTDVDRLRLNQMLVPRHVLRHMEL